jgi:hypothetical protein
MNFVIVILETPNFRFEAVAPSESGALELLEHAWSQHFDDTGRHPDRALPPKLSSRPTTTNCSV